MTIKVLRAAASVFTSGNPTLAAGQPGFETDTRRLKIGNGSTAWNSLGYIVASASPPAWSDVTGKPDFADVATSGDYDDLINTPSLFSGAYGDLSGIPSTFTPATHGHAITDVTGLQTALDGKQAAGTYAAASHGHAIADVTGLQSALDGKQASGSYAATSHGHIIGDVTGLQSALDGKQAAGSYAAATHDHAISDVTGLQTALDGKAASSHGHSDATTSVAGFMSAADKTKLDGIEGNATADQTGAEIVSAIDAQLGSTDWKSGGGGGGDVVGPSSSSANAIALFDGTTGKLIKTSTASVTDNGSLVLPENSLPSPADAGTLKLFAREIASRLMPSFTGPSGLDSALQPLLARNKIGWWNPPGNATTVPGVLGLPAATATGTATARNVAVTNILTRMKRLGFVSAATAAALCGARFAAAQFTTGDGSGLGGFTVIIRFGISDASIVSGARMFVGIRNSVSAPTNVETSTLTHSFGVGHGAADSNLMMYGAGTAAQTPVDLGANFPISNTDAYEVALFSPPSEVRTVHWQVSRLGTSHVASGSFTGTAAQVSADTILLTCMNAYRTNNATAAAVGIDICSVYVETDT